MRTAFVGAVIGVLATACDPGVSPLPSAEVSFLSPTQHLGRASMALRGVRPSIEDLRAVAADPGALPGIVDRYLSSPEFGETIRDLHNEVWLLRIDEAPLTVPAVGALAGTSMDERNRSVYDEPLRLIEDVVMSDQPYTRIVTADYTMADPLVATVWGLPHGESPGWERTTRTNPADHAGILAIPALFMRYRSVGINFNRARANAISKGLLCHDFLDGQVRIDGTVDLSRPDVVRDEVVHNAACASCHQTLDPLASYFFGYRAGTVNQAGIASYPFTYYNADPNPTWFGQNNRPPQFFGIDAVGLEGLGHAIADDPRFARCAATNFAAYLTERDRRELDPQWIARLQQAFVADHFNAKHLARAIVLSDEFRAGASDDPATAEDVLGYQKVRPEQLRRMLAALTGFTWSALDDDREGYRVLAGGIDSFFVTSPVHTFTATSSLVTRAAAEKAALFVVAHDATAPLARRTLFTEADVMSVDEDSVRRQLVALHARIYGELVDAADERIEQTFALFRDALAISRDPRRAWTVTLAGMLGDVRAVYF